MPETRLMLAQEQKIAEFLEQMRHLQQQIWLLHRYAEAEVACPVGFRGVFDMLRPALGELAAASEELARRFSAGYAELIVTADAAARSLRASDEVVEAELSRLARLAEVA